MNISFLSRAVTFTRTTSVEAFNVNCPSVEDCRTGLPAVCDATLNGSKAAIKKQSTNFFMMIRSLKIESGHDLDFSHRCRRGDSSKRRRVHGCIDTPELRRV